MDTAALFGLLGVLVGAVLTAVLGSVLGHRRWVKEVRLDAYVDFLATAARTADASLDDDAVVERTFDAAARVSVVEPLALIDLGSELIEAALDLRETSLTDPSARKRYEEARTAYVRGARKQTLSWWRLGR